MITQSDYSWFTYYLYSYILYPSLMFCTCLKINNPRLWYEGAQKYLGESVTDTELGMEKMMGLCVAIVLCISHLVYTISAHLQVPCSSLT